MAVEVCGLQDIPLLGRHNVANVLAAVAAADAWGVSAPMMRQVIRAFPGVEHRLERVREWHDIIFYNDSIATSPTGTIAALEAIQQPTWLIAGVTIGLRFKSRETIVQRVKGVF
jgi:UDP-N-acetylmuramoylalanine--D-glutamate ligase